MRKIITFFIFFLPYLCFSATFYSRVSGNWNVAATWSTVSCSGVASATAPTATDDVVICGGHTISITATDAITTLTINSTGTLNFTNNLTLTVSGNAVVSGTVTMQNGFPINLNITGNLTMNAATFNHNDNNSTVNLTGTCTNNSGTSIITGTNKGNFYMASSLFVAAGTTLSVGAVDFWQTNITTTTIDGTFLFAGAATGKKIFRGNITVNGTWDDAIGEDPELNGNVVNNGSWIGCTGGTCTYTFGKQVSGTYTLSGNLLAFSNLRVQGGTTVTNLGTVVIDGSPNNALKKGGGGVATFNNGDGIAVAVLYLQSGTAANLNAVEAPGGIIFNASFVNNTVYYSSSNNQNIRIPDDNCYYTLICSNAGTKSFQTAGTIGIRNLLTIKDNAIVDVGTNILADGCGGIAGLTMTDNSQLLIATCASTVPELTGTYSLTGGTITLSGNCATQTLRPGVAYNNLSFQGNAGGAGSAVVMTGVTTINGDITLTNTAYISGNSTFTMSCSKTFTYSSSTTSTLVADINIGSFLQTAGTLIDGGTTITVCGTTWNFSAGTFTATGRVIFNGSTTVIGAATTTFNNITINNSKTLTGHATNMIVKGADFTNNGTYTHNSGTITYSGATAILGTSVTTYNHLTINAGTLTGHATEMVIEGNWTNNSTFTHNNGLVTFVGGAAQSLTGSSSTTFSSLTVNKTAGTILTQSPSPAAITVNALLTITEGIYNVGTNRLNGAGGFTATGGDLRLALLNATAIVPELTGTYAITGGTVTLNGAGTQTLKTSPIGADTYYNLVFSTSGAKTITGLLFINGDATVSGSATLTLFSAFTQASSKTFYYNSTGTTTVTSGVPLIIGNYSQASVAGTFALTNAAGNTLTVRGATWNKTIGTFTNLNLTRVIFNGSSAQTFSHNAGSLSNVTLNNSNGLNLSTDISIATNLTFTIASGGTINTGSYKVILTSNATTVTNAAQANGFVNGNLQKFVSTSPKTFEIGSGGNYAPINFTFAAITTAGYLLCSTTPSDHSDIAAADIDPNKSVNRYWTIDFVALVVTTFDPTFNYPSSEVDAGADVTAFGVQQYNAIAWSNLTVSGTPTTTTTIVTGAPYTTGPTARDYIIGEKFNPNGLYNAVTGAMNWNLASNWIRYRTGTISCTLGNPVVTGVGTIFTSQIIPGDVLILQNNPSSIIGTVLSVDSDGQITLTAGATITSSFSFGIQAIPTPTDEVNIGNPYIAGANVDVTLDISASIFKLVFTRMALSNSLTHGVGNSLTITQNVFLRQPTAVKTNLWAVAGGSGIVGGNLTIGSSDATASYIAKATVTTGVLTVGTNLIFLAPTAASAVNAAMDLSTGGGTGTLNLSGNFSLTNTGTSWGTFTPGASSIVNYNGTGLVAQTVNLAAVGAVGSTAVTYANLNLNNTGAVGATISVAITAAKVTGNIRIQSGKFYTSGLNIAIAAAKTFEVASLATFEMTLASVFPTGGAGALFVFGATSITQYHQNAAKNIFVPAAPGYGHLQVQPTVAAVIHTFQIGTTLVQGNLDLGNGTNTATINSTATAAAINVTGNITINPLATFNLSNTTSLPAVTIAGNWVDLGGTFTPSTKTVTFNGTLAQQINGTVASQTFYNIIISKSVGTLLSCGGSTITLNTNNVTMNTGDFNAPATLNLNGSGTASMILNGGNFTAGTLVTIRGNWTNNGGTFIPNGGLVRFEQGTNPQNINGTVATQTFYNVEVNKTGISSLIPVAPLATLNVNNFTISDLHSNVSALTTFNVDGNFTIAPASGTGTFTPCNNINIKGNIIYNSGTLTWGTNVTLNGSTAQTISGVSTIPNFTNLILNNSFPSTAVTLFKPISVNGVFTLTNGHLITDFSGPNIITLGTAASVVLNAPVSQDNSFVNGSMVHSKSSIGVETKVFPVGESNSGFSTMHKIELVINHSGAGATTYTGKYIFSSARLLGWSMPVTIDSVSQYGYWDISKGGAAPASVVSAYVKLYYLTSDGVSDPANLRVAKGDPSAWTDIGGVGIGSPSGDITSTFSFSTFSFFSLANKVGGVNPLPIELLSFTAKPNGNVVDLKWTTASEMNNDYFTIEKTVDGFSFETVGTKDGAGTITSISNYSTIDNNPFQGLSYYRLKQTDYNGDFAYSSLVPVNFNESLDFAFEIFPNPNDGNNINISMNTIQGDEVLVVVYDVNGKKSYSKVIVTEQNGENVYAIDPSSKLSSGMYLITATSQQKLYSKKLIIK